MRRVPWIAGLAVAMCLRALGQSTPVVHFNIDTTQNVRAISPFIYGVNQSLGGNLSNLTFTRVGGNRWTAYNWVTNASNAGSDYLYENDNYLGGGSTPGGAVIGALNNAGANNAGILLTIPTNGYVSADESGPVDPSTYPSYLSTRFKPEMPAKGSAFTLTPDPNAPVVYQDEFVNWVKTKYPYGATDSSRPIWFSLDNEPDLWSSTHKEVHPAPATYDELVQKSIDYSRAIKAVMPGTRIFGPVNYGWYGYTTLQGSPDYNSKGDFQSYYLRQMAAAEKTYGQRLLDVLDAHWYPEATGLNASGVSTRITGQDTSPGVVAARLQAPRSLWDSTYRESSWIADSINGPIKLLPTLQGKIDANYPGTRLAITEYNYGAGNDISGGIAEADVLGIFGRQGVFAANEWPLASNEAFIAGAFKMFRNFDGKNGAFGDTSTFATTDDNASSSIYTSLDSANPNRMVLVAINKTDHPLVAQFSVNGKALSQADIYQLTSASPNPQYAGQILLTDPSAFSYTMPAYSVSTLDITAVPEPGMLCAGFLLCAGLLHRRRRSS